MVVKTVDDCVYGGVVAMQIGGRRSFREGPVRARPSVSVSRVACHAVGSHAARAARVWVGGGWLAVKTVDDLYGGG